MILLNDAEADSRPGDPMSTLVLAPFGWTPVSSTLYRWSPSYLCFVIYHYVCRILKVGCLYLQKEEKSFRERYDRAHPKKTGGRD